jgi:hypothetical protein
MKNFLILLALTCGQATAQVTNPIFLSCTGQYNNFKEKHEIKLENVVIKIWNDELTVYGIPGLGTGEKYNVMTKTEIGISFAHQINQDYSASLNRFTGSLDVVQWDPTKSRLLQMYKGLCKVAQKIF